MKIYFSPAVKIDFYMSTLETVLPNTQLITFKQDIYKLGNDLRWHVVKTIACCHLSVGIRAEN